MITAIHYQTNEAINIEVDSGVITRISPAAAVPGELPFAAPGQVDLQINGYDGMDFSNPELSADAMEDITVKLAREGVTSYYPTITTYPQDVIAKALANIASEVKKHPLVKASVPGIHLEGPFITREDGARGAHKREHVIPPDWELFQRWQEAAEGMIRLTTCSPEWPEAPQFIRKAVDSGVKVAIGHTAATTEQIKAAADAGATLSTHLGNGSHAMLPRHPNYIWDQLADDRLYATIIADGFHLPDAFLKVVRQVKREKAMIVSDAVALSGKPPGLYTNRKGIQVVKTEEGKLHLAEHPELLAGSAQLMTWGIELLMSNLSLSLAEAWDMASVRPTAYMGLTHGLTVGAPADLVLFTTRGNRIQISETYKNGKCI